VDCLSAPDQTELIERSALTPDRALAIVDDFFDALLTEKLETLNRQSIGQQFMTFQARSSATIVTSFAALPLSSGCIAILFSSLLRDMLLLATEFKKRQ
jgi:hypothetical protein